MLLTLSSNKSNKLVLVKKAEVHFIDISSIIYIEKLQRKSHIITENKTYQTTQSLKEISESLPTSSFFRAHKSFLVNIHKIHEIQLYTNASYIIKFANLKKQATITRSSLNKLIEHLNNKKTLFQSEKDLI